MTLGSSTTKPLTIGHFHPFLIFRGLAITRESPKWVHCELGSILFGEERERKKVERKGREEKDVNLMSDPNPSADEACIEMYFS